MAYLGSYKSRGKGGSKVAITKKNYKEKRMMNRRKKDAPQGTLAGGGSSSRSPPDRIPNIVPNPPDLSFQTASEQDDTVASTPSGLISADTGEGYKSKVGEFLGDVGESTAAFSLGGNPELVAQVQNAKSTVGQDVGALLGTALALGGAEAIASKMVFLAGSTNALRIGNIGTKANVKLPNIVVNSATVRKTQQLIAKVVAKMKKPAYIAGAVGGLIGTYPWSEWALGESKEIMGLTMFNVLKTEDPALIQDYIALNNNIFDMTTFENFARMLPGANLAFSFTQKARASVFQAKINNHVAADTIIQLETGESDDAKYARIAQERVDAKERERASDEAYYAEIQRQKKESKERERASDEAYYDKLLMDRAVRDKEKQDEKDAYWSAYYKALAESKTTTTTTASNSGSSYEAPSKLNFGLL